MEEVISSRWEGVKGEEVERGIVDFDNDDYGDNTDIIDNYDDENDSNNNIFNIYTNNNDKIVIQTSTSVSSNANSTDDNSGHIYDILIQWTGSRCRGKTQTYIN